MSKQADDWIELQSDIAWDEEMQAEICKVCGEEKIWVECPYCGGEGYWDETDIDPLEGDEFSPCAECGTKGGWYECPNAPNHPAPNPACNRPAAFGVSDTTSDSMAAGG